jgi:hypothetical protein
MTVESDLYNTVKSLVGDRVFPDIAPTGAAMPYITYQQVGGDTVAFLERAMPAKKNGYFQVNVWCATRAEAAALMLQIEAAIVTATVFQAEANSGPIAGYTEELATYGYLQQFSIWSDR